ncbi:MAG: hypothetical protein Q8K86_08615 [Candidatus Nanopelagicaceae bacterium]|nr:hypothetical protein [Candidatus Nanopelagicaceae bacterium]
MKARVVAICLILFLLMGSNQALAATPKAGATCTKVGLKSGSLICAKVNGKLKWKIVKKSQTISYAAPSLATVTDVSVKFKYSSSSKLKVAAKNLTPSICTLGIEELKPTNTPGVCTISLSQSGNSYFNAARSVQFAVTFMGTNLIDFKLPGALLLSQGTFALAATSSSDLTVSLNSSTPDTCTVSELVLTFLKLGPCTIVATQLGEGFIPAAVEVSATTEISADRVTADLPDTISGFQLKAIYVVPSDGVDNFKDTNGYLASVLDGGNTYLKGQLNLTVPIDRSSVGYDIQYLKSSYSTEYLATHADASPEQTRDGYVLLDEIKAMENPGDNRKDYIFFLEVPGFSGTYCGLADRPGMVAVVAIQNIAPDKICTGKSPLFFDDYVSKTWVHELFHNFGVGHTIDDPCDLMAGKPETLGTCTATTKYTLDKERTRYVGSSIQGADILKLRVWEGYTADQSLIANCWDGSPVPRTDGLSYAYCPTGTRVIGALKFCWKNITSLSLDEFINGAWQSLGSANHYSELFGGDLNGRKCADSGYTAPWKTVTVDISSIRHYRWIVNGQVAEEINIIWVK